LHLDAGYCRSSRWTLAAATIKKWVTDDEADAASVKIVKK